MIICQQKRAFSASMHQLIAGRIIAMDHSSPDKLDQIVADIFELDAGAVSDALTPDDVEQWTSLNHLRLITAVEEAFNISFSMPQIESIRSIGALRELIRR